MSEHGGDSSAADDLGGVFAESVARLVERIADPAGFPIEPGSSLAGDDAKAHPFEVGQAVRHMIWTAVDHLDVVKTTLVDVRRENLFATATLTRSALECTAAGLWMLGPHPRTERLERTLRWYAQDYHDRRQFVGEEALGADPERRESYDEDKGAVGKVAARLGITLPRGGLQMTRILEEAGKRTRIEALAPWRVASGFAHGRPWAWQGFSDRRPLSEEGVERPMYEWRANSELMARNARVALQLLVELEFLRDIRAGVSDPQDGHLF